MMQAIVKPIVEELLCQHRQALAKNNYSKAPDHYWEDLAANVQYASFVVSHKITYEAALKAARELTFALWSNAVAAKTFVCWAIRFPDSNRYATLDDLDEVHNTLLSSGEILLHTYDEAVALCQKIHDSYKGLGLLCPKMELICFKNDVLQPIPWMTHDFKSRKDTHEAAHA